jgi:hypothetical protein
MLDAYIHVIGPIFLGQAISAFAVTLFVMGSRRATSALGGIALLAGTAGGLLSGPPFLPEAENLRFRGNLLGFAEGS